ncbi:ER degradation-enhancing alpha-mannosidase-like protein 1 Flags: Precursor [Serendipita indica DSM 11827]|nr:ER degradation-enhancing alpha-mannosidase-like protein 1 Flags: Precursor [Serendipita indica DSM 11827]
MDELMPLSCAGRGPDWDDPDKRCRWKLFTDTSGRSGHFGNHREQEEFSRAVKNVIEWVQFDVDTKPQVFEVTIRMLGGLLSGHILASEENLGHKLDWYRGELLDLAKDLGERLLPAFNTPTGLPFARINLRRGVASNESTETCVAGAGSLILEFATLSRLTGDDRFERAAYKAFFSLWNRRSDIGLLGNNIDVFTGKWGGMETTTIGAGVDSFYEYALKWYVLSGEPEFLDVWNEAYDSIMRYARTKDGYSASPPIYRWGTSSSNVDSLSAFWGGLQVLAGDVQNAIKSHLFYWSLWRKYHAIPELFNTASHKLTVTSYPLRPEFIETTFFLYQATKDPFYLDVGAQVYHDLESRTKTECGLAALADVLENRQDDRMESFALSETLKYLYLLFDENNPLASSDSNMVFTTEGHVLTLNTTHLRPMSEVRRESRKHENLVCPVVEPYVGNAGVRMPPLSYGIRSRPDYDYARTLVDFVPADTEFDPDVLWSQPYGLCEVPTVEIFSHDVLLSRYGHSSPEDEDVMSLSRKMRPYQNGVVVTEVMGLRVRIRSRFDGRGYDIVKIGHMNVRQGEKVFFNDTLLFGEPQNKTDETPQRARSVPLRFYVWGAQGILNTDAGLGEDLPVREFVVEADTADFGVDLDDARHSSSNSTFGFSGAHLVKVKDNVAGCSPYSDPEGKLKGTVIYVERGGCLFAAKLHHAIDVGALGVVVANDSDDHVNPMMLPEDVEMFGDSLNRGAMVVIPQSAANLVLEYISMEEKESLQYTAMVRVEREWPQELIDLNPMLKPQPTKTEHKPGRILYINGQPMINTEIMI